MASIDDIQISTEIGGGLSEASSSGEKGGGLSEPTQAIEI